MAIVEDEVRNESEEENEIEVVVEEDDAEPDSDDSDVDGDAGTPDDEDDEMLERKVIELERRISEDPFNYDEHIELIKALWGLSELNRWRDAFDRLQQLTILRPEHWLLRLQTEETLAHTDETRERLSQLFQEATLDCYSIPILSEWCSWALTMGVASTAREQLTEVLRRAGSDPFSGKIFWDAKLELEKTQMDVLSEEDPEYKTQQERILWCLEETVSRPLLRGEEAWPQLEELALMLHDQEYVDKVKKQHAAATEYLHKITPFEDKLLTTENLDEKCQVYQEYIAVVSDLSHDVELAECDSYGILRVLFDRASTECLPAAGGAELLEGFAAHSQRHTSRGSQARVLAACTRRAPRRALYWVRTLQHAEKYGKSFEEVKTIFETALSKGMENYLNAELLWMSYLEYLRRTSSPDNKAEVERLRSTFRLAWDSLAEAWGEEANDCEVPLYWARVEYKLFNDHKQGKEIFEEIFKYGDNKTMSKYWEALFTLEYARCPRLSDHKLRDLLRRALRSVADYPPAVARLWTDFERDHGQLASLVECMDACDDKVRQWRDDYHAMKAKMTGSKKQKGKHGEKKSKHDKKYKDDGKERSKDKGKGKRKSDGDGDSSKVKRKKDADMEVDLKDDSGGGVKRSHDEDEPEVGDSKRQRTDSSSPHRLGTRDACTLFISNLEFKVDEQALRDKLSQYGDIISLRVRKGIKAFGGSICYCQYKTPEAVDEALIHDRSPLDGRPMFFSRYAAKKSKPTFKYSTEVEKNKLFVKNLPFTHCTKDALSEIFDKYGKVKDVRVVTHKDGKPKGLAYIEYEEESAAAQAQAATHGVLLAERRLDVALSAPPPRAPRAPPAALGQAKRDAGGGMRRTQLSSFIPSVLQKPSTSAALASPGQAARATNGSQPTGSHSNGEEKRPLSNSDFRSLLLNKQ